MRERALLARLMMVVPVAILAGPAAAEAVLDGSTGSSGSFAGDFEIPAAVGRLEGSNLFHSFEAFHVRTGESATFTGPGGIANVISRVTGGTASEINGLLASTVPGADFFFLNPAGVLFGPSASLAVPGSFHVSTADELRFDDGAVFSASDPSLSSFTMAPPESFGFLGNAGVVAVDRASFGTGFGQTLSLSGSAVLIDGGNAGVASGGTAGFVSATDGSLQVAAIRSGRLDPGNGELAASELGPVTLSGEATLQVLTIGQGAIRITGGDVTVAERAAVQVFNVGTVDDLNGIEVQADELRISSEGTIGTTATAAGAGGPVRIVAPLVSLDGGSIETSTRADGAGGPIAIASDRVEVTGGRGILATSAGGSAGDAGAIDITARSVLVDQAVIDLTKFGDGSAGQLVIEAEEVVLRGPTFGIQAINPTAGGGGRVEVRVDRLVVDGAGITTSTVGAGPGGDIVLDAGRIEVTDGGQVSAATLGPGEAGGITIRAGVVRVVGLGTGILVSSLADAADGGDGGPLRIDTGRLRLLDGGAISSETSGGGAAGNIVIVADRDALLRNGSQIRASSSGSGRPGDITVRIERLAMRDGGSISSTALATAAPADPASSTVRIVARDRITIEGTPERISGVTTATLGPRRAGTLLIDAPVVQLVGNALLSTSTIGTGDAGAIRLTVGDLLIGPSSFVDSASPNSGQPQSEGAGGEIEIAADNSVVVRGDAATFAFSGITTSTVTRGDAGRIRIEAPLVRLEDGGQISSGTQGEGDGGRIEIRSGRIELAGMSTITTQSASMSAAAGRAGGIRLIAGDALELRDGSVVSAQTASAEAGDIVVAAGELVELRGSAITTSVAGGQGSGGNIFIDPQFVVLNGSRIVANAREGAGGNIRIVAENFFRTPDSVIDASSELGIDGTVDVSAPDLDLTSELAVLPSAYIDVSGLLRESCAARASDQTSSFASTGGGALAPDPAAPLAGRYAQPIPSPRPAAFHHWSLAASDACEG